MGKSAVRKTKRISPYPVFLCIRHSVLVSVGDDELVGPEVHDGAHEQILGEGRVTEIVLKNVCSTSCSLRQNCSTNGNHDHNTRD